MKTKSLFILFPLLAISSLLAGCSSGQPQISSELKEFSFGEVINGDILTKEIAITNNGNTTLVIEGISTSCGCTSAEVTTTQIVPGQSAILTIQFDSGAHGPELTGEFSRQVFIASNDPESPEIVVRFNANIISPTEN